MCGRLWRRATGEAGSGRDRDKRFGVGVDVAGRLYRWLLIDLAASPFRWTSKSIGGFEVEDQGQEIGRWK